MRERGDSTRGGILGGFGFFPLKIFKIKMSVEAILMHFETNFACEIRLIVQAFHLAVFKCVSTTTTTKE